MTYWEEDYSFRDFTLEQIIKDIDNKTITFFKDSHLQATQDIVGFHEDAKFEIFKLDDGSTYFSGDNPLLVREPLNESRNVLERSKEFFIPLNKTYSLRIFHDNRKAANRLYKSYSANGSAWQTNQEMINQSSRFIISDQESIEAHLELGKVITSTDNEKLIDLVRQVVVELKDDGETLDQRKFMEDFLVRYDSGMTTYEDEQELFRQMQIKSKDFIRNRIK